MDQNYEKIDKLMQKTLEQHIKKWATYHPLKSASELWGEFKTAMKDELEAWNLRTYWDYQYAERWQAAFSGRQSGSIREISGGILTRSLTCTTRLR